MAMTPREQLIQEVLQAPDFLVDALLKLVSLVRSRHSQVIQQLAKLAQTSEPSEAISALEIAGGSTESYDLELPPSKFAQELAEAYKAQSSDPEFQEELAVWDAVVGDG